MAPDARIIIDDTDPRIQYSQGWSRQGGGNEYNATTHFTTTAGASFTFVFTGTSIAVAGTVDNLGDSGPPNSTYMLDRTNTVTFRGPTVQGTAYQQVFYQSPTMPNIEHTLVASCDGAGSRLYIDYLVVATPTSGANATVTVTQTVSPNSSSSTSVGGIVGAVLGSVAFALALGSLILIYRRRRRDVAPRIEIDPDPDPASSSQLLPFRSSIGDITSYPPSTTTSESRPLGPETGNEPPSYMAEYGGRNPVAQIPLLPRRKGGARTAHAHLSAPSSSNFSSLSS